MANSNDLLLDANVIRQILVIRASERTARESLRILSEAREYLQNKLSRVGSLTTKKELTELNRQVQSRLIQIYGKYPELVAREQRELVINELDFQKDALSEAIQQAATVTTPKIKKVLSSIANTPMAIGAKGAAVTITDLLEGFASTEAKRAVDRITSGFFNGESLGETAQALSGTARAGFKDGLMNVTRANAYTIAKTGYTHIQETAKQEMYAENDDIIKGYEIVAVLDSKTSQICRSLDGEFYPIGTRSPKPPFHPNCRSTTVAVLKDEYTSGIGDTGRIAERGKPKSSTTYYEWLRSQPASYQNEALGTERGMIFRNAGLSAEEFRKASINRLRQPLTIEQMAQKNKKIAGYLKNQMNELN